MSKLVKEEVGTDTGSDSFLRIFLIPKRMNAYIFYDFMKLLTNYYNNVYETDIFVLLKDLEFNDIKILQEFLQFLLKMKM
ncbi:6159_t:CDS:2 [Cetraspora pellucida]|uniref:6159_t:CDS:1 n=1 Tax=Cetraspora pellucida TaxID=1433469 RepID=A0A9N9BVS3_9GLOM|nr:6159_t:CDS:2 [Cetraspora pellucida]